jgi:hypothetical protein
VKLDPHTIVAPDDLFAVALEIHRGDVIQRALHAGISAWGHAKSGRRMTASLATTVLDLACPVVVVVVGEGDRPGVYLRASTAAWWTLRMAQGLGGLPPGIVLERGVMVLARREAQITAMVARLHAPPADPELAGALDLASGAAAAFRDGGGWRTTPPDTIHRVLRTLARCVSGRIACTALTDTALTLEWSIDEAADGVAADLTAELARVVADVERSDPDLRVESTITADGRALHGVIRGECTRGHWGDAIARQLERAPEPPEPG